MGQWEENGQLLAYVRRKDKNNLECFVGATDEFGQIYLSESGFNCQRNLKVIQSGMRLSKAGEFFNLKELQTWAPHLGITTFNAISKKSTIVDQFTSNFQVLTAPWVGQPLKVRAKLVKNCEFFINTI